MGIFLFIGFMQSRVLRLVFASKNFRGKMVPKEFPRCGWPLLNKILHVF